MTEVTGPVTRAHRILSLDVLRGFAVLGILIMNIQAFAMIGAAYFNPTAYGDLTGANYLVWLFSHLMADMKFMTIFSMLFGAGIVLMAERMEASGKSPAGVHYRRISLLLLFGMAHAWLLWIGDILFTYAMCGFVVFLFRNKPPRTLLILGFISLAVASLMSLMAQFTMPMWPPEDVAEMMNTWAPAMAEVTSELEAYRGGWLAQNVHRFGTALEMESTAFLFNLSWRAGGMMLVGMGLYKLGVFSASLPASVYGKMVLVAALIGLPLVAVGVWVHETTAWSMEVGFFGATQFNYWGSVLVALGWVGLVMLFCQARSGTPLFRTLAATGQMALTNYLMQTIICTTIFYGHGFGLFGSVERVDQVLIVIAVWTVQLLWSPWWLARYRFGPFEWLWRSLTYMRLQPMKR